MYAALKRHLGLLRDVSGTWMAEAVYSRPIKPNLPIITGTVGTGHFYPQNMGTLAQRSYGLCNQGKDKIHGGLVITAERLGSHSDGYCKNCERIKKALERGKPVVYE
jgi:hypothetical protein